jgi:HEAT repeat protein
MAIDSGSQIAAVQSRLISPDAEVRRVGVLEFADSGEEALLPAVIALLRIDPDATLRTEAARALAGCNDVDAVEALAQALNDQACVREAAASSLNELKDAKASQALLRNAGHHDAFVCASVLRTLKELRVPAAAVPATTALEHADPSVRREAVGVLGWLKFAPALTRIARLAVEDVDIEVRRTATGALGMAAPNEESVLGALTAALADPAWQVREEAATTLGKFHAADDRIGAALRTAMRDDYWQVRLRAARSLGRLREVQALPLLIEALIHPAGNLRKEAAIALGEIGDANAAGALNASSADPDPEVRKAARLSLQRLDVRSRKAVQ